MMRALGRLVLVPLGGLLAIAASLTVLVMLGLERITHAVQTKAFDSAGLTKLFELLTGLSALATVMTIVPAFLVVLVGEVGRIRSLTYYVAGGGLALAALPLIARTATLESGLAQFGLSWQVFATAGIAGGFVYWLVAGRTASARRRIPPSSESP